MQRRGESGSTLLAERLYGVKVNWSGPLDLQVEYDAGAPGTKDCDGVAVSYRPR